MFEGARRNITFLLRYRVEVTISGFGILFGKSLSLNLRPCNILFGTRQLKYDPDHPYPKKVDEKFGTLEKSSCPVKPILHFNRQTKFKVFLLNVWFIMVIILYLSIINYLNFIGYEKPNTTEN